MRLNNFPSLFILLVPLMTLGCCWEKRATSYNYQKGYSGTSKRSTTVSKDTTIDVLSHSLATEKQPLSGYTTILSDQKNRTYRSTLYHKPYQIITDTTFYKNGLPRSISENKPCYGCQNNAYDEEITIYYDRKGRALMRTY